MYQVRPPQRARTTLVVSLVLWHVLAWAARRAGPELVNHSVLTAGHEYWTFKVARRLGLAVTRGGRVRPDGRSISWRTAGIEVAASEPSLPFFIEWADEMDLPGRATVAHPFHGIRLARLVIAADPDRLADWLGKHRLPVDVRRGDAAVVQVVLEHAGGETVL
jgi:Glyoxalase-like domain